MLSDDGCNYVKRYCHYDWFDSLEKNLLIGRD